MTRHWPFVLVFCLLLLAGGRDAVDRWIDDTDLPSIALDHSTEVRDRNGQLLRGYTVADGRWRLPVTEAQVDPRFLRMLLTYEDRRFHQHNGVDPRAVLRAAAQAVWRGRIVSGASTLTMQVARLLEQGGTGRWSGKRRQLRLALALERRYSKQQILGLYLSLAPYGGNIEGVRAASLLYFGKEPVRLSPAEAALLVALPQAPERRRPDRAPEAAKAARDRVLQQMVTTGVLPDEVIDAARFDPVPRNRRSIPALAPHLTDRLRRDSPDQQRLDLSLDAGLQAQVERIARQALRGQSDRLSIAILVAEHETGLIRASVGSAGYEQGRHQGFVDMTRALRSPGSTLKPLVYGLAMDAGLIHPQTLINDRPVTIAGYAPQNFDGMFRGELTVANALQQSLNIPVVLLTQEVGPPKLMAAMRQAGMDPVLPSGTPGLAVALGGVGVRLWDLVQLYAGIARGGVGVPLSTGSPQAETGRILSRSTAWHIGHTLSGIAPPLAAPALPVAYKTGTSYGHRDAWAIGFDGRHVVGVWIGRPDGTAVPGVFGGDWAAPVLFDVFALVSRPEDTQPPPPPETLLVGNADLPQPLRRFRGREALFERDETAPKLAFPPNGSTLDLLGQDLVVKLRDGRPPFTVLTDGFPIKTRAYERQIQIRNPGTGFVTLSVIDAAGRADRVQIAIK